jgi:uncharacterized protein (DUF1800 family)
MAAIAVTRFGLGARPGELASAMDDPAGFLAAQIRPSGADQPQANAETAAQRLGEFREYAQFRKDQRADAKAAASPPPQGSDTPAPPDRDPVKMAQKMLREETGVDFLARAQLAANTDAAFRERWTLFWCNHFTVSATKLVTATVVGPFEQEAIRPNVFGTFEDLLLASSAHPAMLLYLDQAQSVGPDTMAARFMSRGGRKGGLNENLAREILELHTVGVDAGYTQADVTEFARAMTGWSIGALREAAERQGRYVFRANGHEPGPRMVMGRQYPDGGREQAAAVMHDLATSPHTAHHVALKVARHFVADDPPPALVSRLQSNFLKTGGRLDLLAQELIRSPEAWEPQARKFKTPYEFVISSFRSVGAAPQRIETLAPLLTSMGQKPFSAPSPKGWDEDAQSWCAPDALIKRMQFSTAFAHQTVGERDPGRLAADALGARLTPPVAKAVSRAESRPEGLAIALMSPEFQRR